MSTRLKVLTKLKKREHRYNKIMGFDIETATEKNRFVLACFYCDEFTKVCNTKQEVVEFLNKRKIQGYKIYATNLAFDFLGSLYEHSHRWSVLERNGCIYSFTWYQTVTEDSLKHPVKFYDTIRILPASVEKLGKILQVPKMEHPTCFGNSPKNYQERMELTRYCMNDAKISYLFIKDIFVPFLKKYNLPIKPTIGSTALQDFRTNYLDGVIFQEPEENRTIAFKGYYGGRTETYQRGKFKNVYCFDVNSLYPSVMRKAYPDPNRSRHLKHGTKYNINKHEGVSDVTVYIPTDINIPPLPYKTDSKLIFPTGTISGYYNHNELRNALKHGCIVKEIREQLVYPRKRYFFRDFVDKHYSERLKLQAKGDPMQIMEKNVLNNLYGKFAFNYRESSSLIPAHDFDFEKHVKDATYIEPMFNNEFISIKQQSVKAPIYSFPILSSYITSEARILMYEYLSDKNLQHKIISTDTDSIFIKDYDGEIETSNEIGCMKLEDGYPINEGYFVRPKMYMTHSPKCKGVQFRKEGVKRFMEILDGKEITQDRFVKYRTAIKSKTHHKNGTLSPNQIIQITKNLDLEDTKRVWSKEFEPFGQEVSTPIYIPENINTYKEVKESIL